MIHIEDPVVASKELEIAKDEIEVAKQAEQKAKDELTAALKKQGQLEEKLK